MAEPTEKQAMDEWDPAELTIDPDAPKPDTLVQVCALWAVTDRLRKALAELDRLGLTPRVP